MNYNDLYNQRREQGAVSNLTPQFVKFEKEGDRVIGRLVAVTEIESRLNEGTYNQYVFDSDNGRIKFALGRQTDQEIGGSLRAGEIYAITYLGKEEVKGGRRVNKFQVEHVLEQPASAVGGDDDIPF